MIELIIGLTMFLLGFMIILPGLIIVELLVLGMIYPNRIYGRRSVR